MHHNPTITGRKIKIMVEGCGHRPINHFCSIKQHSDELGFVAIYDRNPVVLAKHAEKYKVPAYRHMEEMLQKDQIVMAALYPTSGIHPNQTLLADRQKAHVIPEKSIATLWNDGVSFGGEAVNGIQLWQFDEPKDCDLQTQEANYSITSVYGFGHPFYYKNVDDVICEEPESQAYDLEGLKSPELLIDGFLGSCKQKTFSLLLEFR